MTTTDQHTPAPWYDLAVLIAGTRERVDAEQTLIDTSGEALALADHDQQRTWVNALLALGTDRHVLALIIGPAAPVLLGVPAPPELAISDYTALLDRQRARLTELVDQLDTIIDTDPVERVGIGVALALDFDFEGDLCAAVSGITIDRLNGLVDDAMLLREVVTESDLPVDRKALLHREAPGIVGMPTLARTAYAIAYWQAAGVDDGVAAAVAGLSGGAWKRTTATLERPAA